MPQASDEWPQDGRTRSSRKLSQLIADAISAEIVAEKRAVGDFLGRESDIQERFKASRSILREALMILENEGVARMRRGRVGGLVVVATPVAGAIIPAANYLFFCNLSPQELIAAWLPVEDFTCQAAVGRASGAQLDQIRVLLDLVSASDPAEQLLRVRDLRRAVLNAASNPVLALYEMIYARLQLDFTVFGGRSLEERSRVEGEYIAHRCDQARAVLAGDPIEAVLAGRRARALFHPFIAAERLGDAPLPQGVIDDYERVRSRVDEEVFPEVQVKRSTTLAYEIFGAIRGAASGSRIGSEPELLQRFGVARGTLREAIRTLERHGVVVMEAGQSGGLFVGVPNPDAALRSTHNYLRSLNLKPHEFFEAAELLFIVAAGLAAQQPDAAADVAGLRNFTVSGTVAARDDLFHQAKALGEAGGNAFVAFMLRVTTRLATRTAMVESAVEAAAEELNQCWTAMIAAIAAGDVTEARRTAIAYQRALGRLYPGMAHGGMWAWRS